MTELFLTFAIATAGICAAVVPISILCYFGYNWYIQWQTKRIFKKSEKMIEAERKRLQREEEENSGSRSTPNWT